MRLDADYTAEFVFTFEGATADIQAASDFIAAARQILQDSNWLDQN